MPYVLSMLQSANDTGGVIEDQIMAVIITYMTLYACGISPKSKEEGTDSEGLYGANEHLTWAPLHHPTTADLGVNHRPSTCLPTLSLRKFRRFRRRPRSCRRPWRWRESTARLLIDNNADPNLCSTDGSLRTPLHGAAKHGDGGTRRAEF